MGKRLKFLILITFFVISSVSLGITILACCDNSDCDECERCRGARCFLDPPRYGDCVPRIGTPSCTTCAYAVCECVDGACVGVCTVDEDCGGGECKKCSGGHCTYDNTKTCTSCSAGTCKCSYGNCRNVGSEVVCGVENKPGAGGGNELDKFYCCEVYGVNIDYSDVSWINPPFQNDRANCPQGRVGCGFANNWETNYNLMWMPCCKIIHPTKTVSWGTGGGVYNYNILNPDDPGDAEYCTSNRAVVGIRNNGDNDGNELEAAYCYNFIDYDTGAILSGVTVAYSTKRKVDPDVAGGRKWCYECTGDAACDYRNEWHGGGNTAGCGNDPTSYYRDFYCSSGHTCASSDTDSKDCDSSDVCGNVCDGTVIKSYLDYYVVTDTDQCAFEWGSTVEDCAARLPTDSDGGDVPSTAGMCTSYTGGCSGGACTSTTYNDVCTSTTQLTEYYASGASCLTSTYGCSDFEAAATGDISNDPTTTGTCTARTGAGCSSGAFSTAAGTGSGTEGCVDSNECFSNGGAGGGNCIFTEYYAVDSGDACTGLDSCASTTYDPDTNSNTCGACVGSDRFDIGGDISACCGDDASEYYEYRMAYKVEGQYHVDWDSDSSDDACCDNDGKDCVSSGVCYAPGEVAEISGVTNDKKGLCEATTSQWLDLDGHQSGCGNAGYGWSTAGETGVGEYGLATDGGDGTTECCGDDATEDYRTRAAGTDSTYASDPNDKACCSESSKCVYSSTCFNGGSTGGSIPDKNYCNAGTWVGGDAGNTQCTAIVGSGYWNLGGDVASTTCCGDDASENKRTCQDGGEGACAESTDDEACCSDSNACVYNDGCYSNNGVTPNNDWICVNGAWERLGMTVVVDATPTTVTTTWQNTDATASVSCTTTHSSVQCDTNSYRLNISATSISACSTDYDNDYSPPGTQTISSHSWVCGAAKDTLGNEGFSDPVEFLLDKTNPTASLDSLPAWTNQDAVTVGWSGSDTESGVDYFELEYSVTMVDGSVVQNWAAWTTSVSNPGTLPFSDMQNNRTYHFRIRATDNAGNTGSWSSVESIGVDMVDPTCDVGDLPMYTTSSSFIVNWAGSDDESGIQHYDVQARAETTGCGISTTWDYLNGLDDTTETSYERSYQDSCTYYFRCRATDFADNEGTWSAVKNTTVDATDPISSVDPLPEWLNVTNFTVSWSGYDAGSGIDCYDINWSDGSGWNDWFTCTQILSSMFGPDSPVSVTEGVTYSFSSRATDVAGNVENWPSQPDAYTTIDLTPPQYDLRAYDQGGREISGFVPPGRAERVILSSTATDSISGVEHNYIEYRIIRSEGEETYSFDDCGSASPYGGISECNVTIDFAGVLMLDFWVKVIDRAGNVNISNVSHITTHPLTNFAKHSVHLIMGSSVTSKVYVRNMQTGVDNVTVTLSGGLPVDPYFIVMEGLKRGNNTWVGKDIELRDNNKTIVVKNMNPNSQRSFIVQIWSTEPDIYYMVLDAYSALNEDVTDTDQAVVRISYPASFPGLNEWAILILIIVAVFGYLRFGREMR